MKIRIVICYLLCSIWMGASLYLSHRHFSSYEAKAEVIRLQLEKLRQPDGTYKYERDYTENFHISRTMLEQEDRRLPERLRREIDDEKSQANAQYIFGIVSGFALSVVTYQLLLGSLQKRRVLFNLLMVLMSLPYWAFFNLSFDSRYMWDIGGRIMIGLYLVLHMLVGIVLWALTHKQPNQAL